MRRRTRRLAVAAALVVVVLVAVRLALDPVATWRVRRSLATLRGMHGTVADVEVHVAPPSVALHGLRLEKMVEGRRVPFVEVERATFRFEWRELLRGRVVSRADVEAPKMHVLQREGSAPKAEPGEHQRVQEAPRAGSGLERLGALGVDRAQVRRGEIVFAEARDPGTPVLRLHDIELAAEGLSSRRPAKERQPMVLAGRATLQRTGKVSVFATADPAAKAPTFAGRGSLTGLRFEELHALVAGKSAIAPSRGSLDLVIQFEGLEGRIAGTVRPVLTAAGTRADEPGLLAKLKSMVADQSLDVFRDDVRGGADPSATTIPIAGTVKNPGAHPMAVVAGLLRNAFVMGLTAAFHGPPPPKAKDQIREQARQGMREGAAARRRAERK